MSKKAEVESVPEELERPFRVQHEELSTNFFWVSASGFNFQTTVRGNPTRAEIIEHLETVKEAAIQVIALKGQPKPVGQSSPTPTPAKDAPETAPASNGGNHEAACAMLEIGTSYQGGKTQLKFHCDGMEHPLTYTKAVGEMVKLLAPLGHFTAEHIVPGKKYPIKAVVVWVQNEKYRNVVAVRNA